MQNKLLKEIISWVVIYFIFQIIYISDTKNIFSLRVTLIWLIVLIIAVLLSKRFKK